jgi:deoxyribodipyrimidine photo-lyase
LKERLPGLARSLGERGHGLIEVAGKPAEILPAMIQETGASRLHWTRRGDPFANQRDQQICANLATSDCTLTVAPPNQLLPPDRLRTRNGAPYRLFTPFWRACQEALAPLDLTAATTEEDSREDEFLQERIKDYPTARDRLPPTGTLTSGLATALRWGETNVASLWSRVRAAGIADPTKSAGAEAFLRQLGWREFCRHLLWHNPDMPTRALTPRFQNFPWRNNPQDLLAWQKGQTGYPLVDAAMRQLETTGDMPNRLRMVTASFLTKHLLLPWQTGAAWFWEKLVDADLANNAANWQWVAGCGTDAAPFIRIFNPVRQGELYDPEAQYISHWVPELARLPPRFRHAPWLARPLERSDAGVVLGKTYPSPVIDHIHARQRALSAFAGLPSASPTDILGDPINKSENPRY